MIRIGEKYIDPASVRVIEPFRSDPDNWSSVLIGDNWVSVNAPVAVVADRIHDDETEAVLLPNHDAPTPTPRGVLATLPAGYRPVRTTMIDLDGIVFTVDAEGNVRSVNA